MWIIPPFWVEIGRMNSPFLTELPILYTREHSPQDCAIVHNYPESQRGSVKEPAAMSERRVELAVENTAPCESIVRTASRSSFVMTIA